MPWEGRHSDGRSELGSIREREMGRKTELKSSKQERPTDRTFEGIVCMVSPAVAAATGGRSIVMNDHLLQ